MDDRTYTELARRILRGHILGYTSENERVKIKDGFKGIGRDPSAYILRLRAKSAAREIFDDKASADLIRISEDAGVSNAKDACTEAICEAISSIGVPGRALFEDTQAPEILGALFYEDLTSLPCDYSNLMKRAARRYIPYADSAGDSEEEKYAVMRFYTRRVLSFAGFKLEFFDWITDARRGTVGPMQCYEFFVAWATRTAYVLGTLDEEYLKLVSNEN